VKLAAARIGRTGGRWKSGVYSAKIMGVSGMIRWLTAGALVALLAWVGAMGCGGGDDPLTLTQFFSKWEEVSGEGRARIQGSER